MGAVNPLPSFSSLLRKNSTYDLAIIIRLFAAFSIALATACGPAATPVKPVAPTPKPSANAENFLSNKNYLGAADEFARLSQLNEDPVSAQRYAMRAALAYIDAENFDSAANLFTATVLTDEQSSTLAAVGKSALAQKSPTHQQTPSAVRAALGEVDIRALTPYQRGFYYRVSGFNYFALANYLGAATELSNATRYPLPDADSSRVSSTIWQSVSRVDDAGRGAIVQQGDNNLIGWLALKDSTEKVLHDPVALNAAISNWRAQFPSHPANSSVVEELYEIAESLSQSARHIALLLPFEGRYKLAAEAIRDGFMSAWFDDEGSRRPVVSVYSVNPENVVSVYQQAVATGADFIVGPLERRTISTLLSTTKVQVPIFLLNQIDAETHGAISANPALEYKPERVYQFALTPESEAYSVAQYAWNSGIRRAAAIAPQTTLGDRLITAFSEKWEALGGIMLQPVQYDEAQSRYVSAVRKTFNLDLSTARGKRLSKALGRQIVQEPRARKDVDGIFIGGLPVDNRQLIPQLRYFGVARVPMFSSSHTFAGVRDPGNDLDLDGANFGDMAWILGSDTELSSYRTFRDNWPQLGPQLVRMHAFGLDAYALVPRIARFRYQNDQRFEGATGTLSVTRDGEVSRELVFAKFVNGVPKLSEQRSPSVMRRNDMEF